MASALGGPRRNLRTGASRATDRVVHTFYQLVKEERTRGEWCSPTAVDVARRLSMNVHTVYEHMRKAAERGDILRTYRPTICSKPGMRMFHPTNARLVEMGLDPWEEDDRAKPA